MVEGRTSRGSGASGFDVYTRGTGFFGLQRVGFERLPQPCDTECHAVAALALYGQPFGFTREDVKLLRDEAEGEWNGEQMDVGRRLLRLADRIEALLPPEKP